MLLSGEIRTAEVAQSQQAWAATAAALSLEDQREIVEQAGIESLLFCPDSWALRHRLIDRATGETRRARCNSWSCPYCGPRKVDRWRRIIELAQPTLFVTLTRVGRTVEEAARTLTTVLQYLRRGSKGRGRGRVDAREAYPIEFFATLEEHRNREEVGFHWHLLVVGVEYLPKQVVSDALRSATKHLYPGGSYIVDVRRVKNLRAVGYVTKYLTKDVQRKQRGVVQQERQVSIPVYEGVSGTEYSVSRMVRQADGSVDLVVEDRYAVYDSKRDEQGCPVVEEETRLVEKTSKAHRVRYSKRFFPGKTRDLWRFICEGNGLEALQACGGTLEAADHDDSLEDSAGELVNEQNEEHAVASSGWMLYEAERVEARSAQEYQAMAEEAYGRMRRAALEEALEEVRAGRRLYSRRVHSIWKYQRERVA